MFPPGPKLTKEVSSPIERLKIFIYVKSKNIHFAFQTYRSRRYKVLNLQNQHISDLFTIMNYRMIRKLDN